MTTSVPTFTGNQDRARVLTEILREGPAVSGSTLIALVDRATQEVMSVRSMPTPDESAAGALGICASPPRRRGRPRR